MRRSQHSRAVLRDANSILRPGAMSVAIGAITRSAGRLRQPGKHFAEPAEVLPDYLSLNCGGQESLFCRSLRIPILVTDPRHAPMDVGRSRAPQRAKKR